MKFNALLSNWTHEVLINSCTSAACDDLAKHIPNCAEPVYDFEQGTVTFECQSGCVPSGMNLPLRCNPLTKNFEGTSTFKCIKGMPIYQL